MNERLGQPNALLVAFGEMAYNGILMVSDSRFFHRIINAAVELWTRHPFNSGDKAQVTRTVISR